MLENIIAHRGYWLNINEQNTELAFNRALSHGFGIETDLRDRNGQVVISHDMATSENMEFEDFISLCRGFPSYLKLALNIKADGLQNRLMETKIDNLHFYFDMSVPDMLGYKKNALNLYTRYSDIEEIPSLYNDSKGVWLDNFSTDILDNKALEKFLNDGKEVTLVSPELHKRNEINYWASLKRYMVTNPNHNSLISLCTDYPVKANEYFNEK